MVATPVLLVLPALKEFKAYRGFRELSGLPEHKVYRGHQDREVQAEDHREVQKLLVLWAQPVLLVPKVLLGLLVVLVRLVLKECRGLRV